MASQREREAFVGVIVSEGGTVSLARALMRAGATLHRLAEAQCNGDWPYWHPERPIDGFAECAECEARVHRTFRRAYMSEGPGGRTYYKRVCQRCHETAHVRDILKPVGWSADCHGDPRGAVIPLARPERPRRRLGRGRGPVVPEAKAG